MDTVWANWYVLCGEGKLYLVQTFQGSILTLKATISSC